MTGAAALALSALSLGAPAGPDGLGEAHRGILYGEDSRARLPDLPPPLRAFAETRVVALVPRGRVVATATSVRLDGPRLDEARRLCPEVPFGAEPVVASCSGVWLDDRRVLTAGHCVADTCLELQLVTGYGGGAPAAVHGCAEVLARQVDALDAPERLDYAILVADRPHPPATAPLPIGDPPGAGAPLVAVGHPFGVALVADLGASVVDASMAGHFLAAIDTAEGGSGSPVLDAEGRLVGIVTQGGRDLDFVAGCFVEHVASAGGEVVTRATAALADAEPSGCTTTPPASLAPLLVLVALTRRGRRTRRAPPPPPAR